MRKLLCILSVLLLTSTVYGQRIRFELAGSGVHGKLNFPGFANFVQTYNDTNAASPGFEAMKFNQGSTGYNMGFYATVAGFFSGISMGQTWGSKSYANFNYDQRRGFQFRSYNFDILVGGRIGNQMHGVIPYVGMGINTLNLHAWYEYGDLKSFGGETSYSGVWTSWRMAWLAGLRYQFSMDRLGIYFDYCTQINQEEYLGGDFKESNSATDSGYFPSIAGQDWLQASSNGLKEIYRQSRASIGITFQLNEPSED